MYEVKDDNRFLVGVLVIGFVLFALWVCNDLANKPIVHYDTDNAMADIEKRIDRIESRLDSVSARLDQAEKTAADLGGRIDTSTELAKEVGAGIGTVEARLDSVIQRSGRIANIIADIEAKNK